MSDQTESTKKYEELLPFNAINEFMRDDYRQTVLHEVLTQLDEIQPELKKEISTTLSRRVKIPGFRNSNLAPIAMKAKNAANLFQQSARFASLIVDSWASLHPELKTTVWKMLTERGWEPASLETSRIELPGFQVHWPKADTFEVLGSEVRKMAPDLSETDDDISLMAVWLGNRLPYDLFVDEEEAK